MTTKFLKDISKLVHPHGFIAGGACVSVIQEEKINDIDIFGYSEKDVEKLLILLLNAGYKLIHNTKNAYTFEAPLTPKVQLLKNRYGTPEEVCNNFDFVHTKVYFKGIDDLGSNIIFVNGDGQDVYKAIKTKKLILNNTRTEKLNENTALRVIRFTARGYKISKADALKIFHKSLENYDPKTATEIEEYE